MRRIVVSLIALAMTISMAHAGEKSEKKEEKVCKKALELYDADKDGKLSEEEKATMKADKAKKMEAEKAKMMEKYDTDKDGKLSAEEKAAMKAEKKKGCEEKASDKEAKKVEAAAE